MWDKLLLGVRLGSPIGSPIGDTSTDTSTVTSTDTSTVTSMFTFNYNIRLKDFLQFDKQIINDYIKDDETFKITCNINRKVEGGNDENKPIQNIKYFKGSRII